MKQLLLLLCCLPLIGLSQIVPQGINYQAVARDTTGSELSNMALTAQFSVLSGSAIGAITWQETHSVNTNDYGQ